MKLLLLKVLLRRRARDEGFTLPMVIALGLVMLLLGTVNIVKSGEENINTISQNSASDALAVAEVGITKYRELLNQNRILTIYNDDQWDTNTAIVGADTTIPDDDQTCDDMTDIPVDPSTGDDIWTPSSTGTATKPNDTGDNDWWEIREDIDEDGTADPIGEYRLVSYVYDNDGDLTTDNNGDFNVFADVNANFPTDTSNDNDTDDDGVSDARGILTVQGRSPDGSVAQIEVEIPLRINDLANFAPVLWVGSGAIATPGTLNISNPDDNIVLSDAGTGCSTPGAIAGNSNVISDPRNLPDISDLSGIPAAEKNIIGAIDTTGARVIFPRPLSPSDNENPGADPIDNNDDRFLYEVTTINVENNDLVTDGIAQVTLYVTNSITISGTAGTTRTIGSDNAANPATNADCKDSDDNLLSYANFNCANDASTSVSSANLEIHVDGNQTININPNGGTVNIEALIHAPEATLNITGSGTVNINGAIWVNNFNNTGTATVNIRSDQTDTTTTPKPSYKFYTTIANMTPRPLTSTPTDWVREEVQ
jgi:hypothetical protein